VNSADTSGILQLQTASTAALTIDASQNTTLAGTLTTTGITNSGVATATRFNPTGSSVTGNGMYLPAANSLGLSTNGTNAVYIDSSQNVGIGTTSPQTKLQVLNEGSLNTDLDGNSSNATIVGNNKNATDNQGNLFIISNSTATDGFGGSICFGGRYTGSNTAAFARVGGVRTGGTFSGALTFYARNSSGPMPEAARIDSSGNLLVGTTSTFSPGGVPTTSGFSTGTAGNWALGIRNTTTASNPFGLAIQYPNGAPNSASAQFIFCQDNSGTKFDVRSNGGIGNYSANNVNLSDQREKKNIEIAGSYLTKVCAIPVKTFLYNDQTDTDLNLGAIAQDVQAVAPELVMESNWGTAEEPKMRLSIYQTDLQYALMKSIQELKAINDTQAETINALTARIVALEGK